MEEKTRFDAINTLLTYCYMRPELRIGQIITNLAAEKDLVLSN